MWAAGEDKVEAVRHSRHIPKLGKHCVDLIVIHAHMIAAAEHGVMMAYRVGTRLEVSANYRTLTSSAL